MKLYKFTSLENLEKFERVMQTLKNQKIYCPTYDQLNDPFEGMLGVIPPEPQDKVDVEYLNCLHQYWEDHLRKIRKYRVCSLTTSVDNILMWAHYSAGFTGICIEFEIKDEAHSFYNMNYVDDVSKLIIDKPIEYLTTKLDCWQHEREVRYITNEEYLDVSGKIKSIYIGGRMKLNKEQINQLYELIINNKWRPQVAQPTPQGEIRFI